PHGRMLQIGEWTGWLALLIVAAAWLVFGRRPALPVDDASRIVNGERPTPNRHVWAVFGLFAGVWAACTAARWDAGQWLAYHTLLLAWAAAALALLAAFRAVRWVALLGS